MKICKLNDDLAPQALKIYKNCLNQSSFSENSLKLTNSYPHNHIYLAKAGQAVCGLIDYSILSDQAFVNNIATVAQYRNSGVASKLMESMLTKCKNLKIKSISLEARVSNQAAINLYKKFGFSKISRRKRIYSDPVEDGWVMALEMKYRQ